MKIKDQLGRDIALVSKPQRIVSLVPSQTQLLADLGLDKEVVGITKFCVHPKGWRREKTVIGGTKDPKIDRIKSLKPDFIIANKEENNREDIEQLMDLCPVYISDVETLDDNLSMIEDLGEICGTKKAASKLISDIKAAFATLSPPPDKKPRVMYFIWKNPWMVAGSDTFIHQMLNACGMENVIEQERYPEIDEATIKALDPNYVFLSSEPFPFKAKHLQELHRLAPNAVIQLVNGEYFSWYGSMVKHSPAYFRGLRA